MTTPVATARNGRSGGAACLRRRGCRPRPLGAALVLALGSIAVVAAGAPPASARTGAGAHAGGLHLVGGGTPGPATALRELMAGADGMGRVADGLAVEDAALTPPPASAAALAAPARFVTGGRDAPDPFALVAGRRVYLYTSQAFGSPVNVPVQSGPSLGRLGPVTDALPSLPPWAAPGFTWAPDVHRFGRRWVLYFTAVVAGKRPAEECIGDAVADDPSGPFAPLPKPIVCQGVLQGSIDPRTFVGPRGAPYLLWKSDENAAPHGPPSGIWSQRLRGDGLRLRGTPTKIFQPDERWQGRIVEAPDLVRAGRTDWLFYSGGWFNQPSYGIGVARCRGPSGPCVDTSRTPWLASNAQGAGPGEESVLVDAGGAWLLYTPWRSLLPKPGTRLRPVAVAQVGFGPGGPYLAAPGPLPGAAGGTLVGRASRRGRVGPDGAARHRHRRPHEGGVTASRRAARSSRAERSPDPG